VDLGGHAGERELFDLVATLSRQPFDRGRPLWEFVVVEGLAGGRAAMVQRLHHTITDGKGGIRLSLAFLDLERDPDEPPAPQTGAVAGAPGAGATAGASGGGDGGTPWWSRTAGAAGHAARSGLGRLGGAAAGLAATVRHPGELPARGSDALGLARSALHQVRVDGRRSPLWTERSLARWFGVTQLHLDDVRAAAATLGGSVNDVFVTGATAAAGRAHDRAGRPVDELRVSMPVSTRHDRRAGGNAFAPTQALVPTAPMDAADRFAGVHAVLDRVKAERVLGSMESAAAALSLLPTGVLVRTGQRVAGSVDFVCSNVRAAPFDLYIAGALMQANYPIGPLAGTAFNLTTMSYRGWMFLGLVVDTVAVSDPEALLGDLREAYDEVLRAGGVRRPRRFS
jgi:WS/DGAT/MGAT family acyltransferase